jgi:hypothetical protein
MRAAPPRPAVLAAALACAAALAGCAQTPPPAGPAADTAAPAAQTAPAGRPETPTGPPQTPDAAPQAPESPAQALEGPSQAPEGPSQAPEGPAPGNGGTCPDLAPTVELWPDKAWAFTAMGCEQYEAAKTAAGQAAMVLAEENPDGADNPENPAARAARLAQAGPAGEGFEPFGQSLFPEWGTVRVHPTHVRAAVAEPVSDTAGPDTAHFAVTVRADAVLAKSLSEGYTRIDGALLNFGIVLAPDGDTSSPEGWTAVQAFYLGRAEQNG